ncbi:MAG: DUF1929 domain-containing protein [Rhodocyclaceae bacterium]|nr:DUF1929 domain-containing protein [Rhodocyclaceae bacterium]
MAQSFWGSLTVKGEVRDPGDTVTRRALRVEAWDATDGRDDFLGAATLDDMGRFEIEIDRALLRDFGRDYVPAISFSIFDGDQLIDATEPTDRSMRHDGVCILQLPKKRKPPPYRCDPRHIYLKIEKLLAYSPVDPDADAHGMYRRDCMHGEGHDNGQMPDAEVSQRSFDAIVYREYLDAAFTVPRTTAMVPADVREPVWYRRVPGAVLYLKPGRRVHIHVLNADDRPHSLHVHGLAYGVDSDGSYPLGVAGKTEGRSDEICPGEKWVYEFDVTDDMIGCWPFHPHVHHVQEVTDLGLFGGIVVRDPKRPQPDIEVPFFLHRMAGTRSGAAFDSNNIAMGAAFSYAFPSAGTFNYYCRFHPMNGTVTVLAGAPAAASVTIRDGPARFDPPAISVAPGGTVTWTNAGIQMHTVTESAGAGSLESWCINGRSFFGNTPLIEGKSGARIRWYVFNLDLSGWHNFHTHGQRWFWAGEAVDTRSVGPAESFVADTRMPDVVLPPCRRKKPPEKDLREYHFCGDFLVHCHIEHHMMQGMVAAVRAQQHLQLTRDEYERLRFKPNHYCMPASHGGHGGCPHVDHDRCASGGGMWESMPDSPSFVVHAALMHDGRVLVYPGTAEVGYPLESYIFDPVAGTFSGPQNYGEDIFCSGQTFLPDGRLLVAGGAPQFFLASTHLFDPLTASWSKLAGHDMHLGRWYPTLVPLADGRVLAVSGRNGVAAIEIFDPASSSWTLVSGADKDFSQLYPSLHLLPAGPVFYSRTGWNPMSGTLSARLDFSGAYAGSWTDQSPMQFPDRQEGASVILVDDSVSPPNVRIVVFGGGVSGAFNKQSCEMIDVTAPSPASSWMRMADLHFPRTNVNGVLLPDGRILAIGGQRNGKWAADPAPVLEAEMFDPQLNAWTVLAAMQTPRQYHSVAVLLPDGRVFTAGGIDPTQGGAPARDLRKVEIFSPPYLFKGPRPGIAAAPANAAYGASIVITSPDAPNIGSVVLMRPAAVTHHTDAGLRRILLRKLAVTAASVTVQIPADGRILPPGHYMLFVLDGNDVPSVANWIHIG